MPSKSIRNFARFFTNLTNSQKQEFNRVFDDLQNSLEVTSLSTSLELLRKKPDQNLPIPVISINPSVRGGIVSWVPLPDQRINFYEVDLSPTSNFSSVTTVTSFDTSVTIDGLTETQFVRVRGVRSFNGTVTPYSETGILAPNLFDIRTHLLEEFYVNCPHNQTVVLGGADSTLDYIPTNPNGFSMVWGGVSIYANPNVALSGNGIEIPMQVFARNVEADSGITYDDTEYWRITSSEFFGTYAIGPFVVPHPELNDSLQIRFEITDTAEGSGTNTQIQWLHLNVLELGIS